MSRLQCAEKYWFFSSHLRPISQVGFDFVNRDHLVECNMKILHLASDIRVRRFASSLCLFDFAWPPRLREKTVISGCRVEGGAFQPSGGIGLNPVAVVRSGCRVRWGRNSPSSSHRDSLLPLDRDNLATSAGIAFAAFATWGRSGRSMMMIDQNARAGMFGGKLDLVRIASIKVLAFGIHGTPGDIVSPMSGRRMHIAGVMPVATPNLRFVRLKVG